MTAPVLHVWFEFASTYSYPAVMRVVPLAQAAGVELQWHPFLLGPIFKAQGWTTSPFNVYSAKGVYMWRDVTRICDALDLPFAKPDPFPQSGLLAARTSLVAIKQGFGAAFIKAVYAAEFAKGRQIADPAVVADIVTALGHNAAEVLARAQSEEIKAGLRTNTAEADRIGIFGAPSFVTADGEMFWGNDRLEQALAWATR